MLNETSMGLTNQEFFRESMYFTDEVRLSEQGEHRFVNEFLVCNNIGRGSYSKVKRVIRLEHGSETMLKLQTFQAKQAQSQQAEEGEQI
jgi:hypothetical protein